MNKKITLILFLCAAGLFAFIKFYERELPGTRQREYDSRHLFSFDPERLGGITITNNDIKIRLRKRDDLWLMTSPAEDLASPLAIRQILEAVAGAHVHSVIDAKDEKTLKDYGLEKSTLRLALLGKNEPPEILFGKETAVEGKIYARLQDSNKIYVIDDAVKKIITGKPDSFRDPRIINFAPLSIERLTIKNASGEIDLQKKGEHWQMEKPLKARGNDAKIAGLLQRFSSNFVEIFVPEKSINPSEHGLDDPRATVTIHRTDNEPLVLKIGKNLDEKRIYAHLAPRNFAVILPTALEDYAHLKPNDLRDRKFLRLDLDIVDRIRIKTQDSNEIMLSRNGEEWRLPDMQNQMANPDLVHKLIETLTDQEVVEFVADVASELPKYGLDQPLLKIAFSSYASENTAESKAGEQQIVSVSFGKVEGDVIYAHVDDEPFVVSLPKSILDEIPSNFVAWKNMEIKSVPVDSISHLTVKRGDSAPVEFEKKPDGSWSSVAGATDKINIVSLLNTLSSFRPVRWIGPAQPSYHFDTPVISIECKTGQQTIRLVIGNKQTDDDFWFATMDGTETFLLSKPDFEAFNLPLLQAAPQ